MSKEKPIWQKNRMELFRDYSSSDAGLTDEEAKKRLEQYGPNELQEGKRKSVLRIFLEQFADFTVIILIIAAIISGITGSLESTIVIVAVITMNAILGTVQTVRASASLDSLRQMSAQQQKCSGMDRCSRSRAERSPWATWSFWRRAIPSARMAACWNVPA